MSKRNPTIGGKGKPAVDKPPKPVVYHLDIKCDCGIVNRLVLTTPCDIYKLCECGSMIKYLSNGVVTIEKISRD